MRLTINDEKKKAIDLCKSDKQTLTYNRSLQNYDNNYYGESCGRRMTNFLFKKEKKKHQ